MDFSLARGVAQRAHTPPAYSPRDETVRIRCLFRRAVGDSTSYGTHKVKCPAPE
jgi:hypothetical protein